MSRYGKQWWRFFWDYPLEKAGVIVSHQARSLRWYGFAFGEVGVGIFWRRATDEYGPPIWERGPDETSRFNAGGIGWRLAEPAPSTTNAEVSAPSAPGEAP